MTKFLDLLLLFLTLAKFRNYQSRVAPFPKAQFLWGVINSTLHQSHVPTHCAKIAFTDNISFTTDLGESFSFLILNLHNIQDFVWDQAESILSNHILDLIEVQGLEPCLIVVSIVLEPLKILPWENDYKKRDLRHRLSDLFGFWTPVTARHFIFVRITGNVTDLNPCSNSPRYPTRRISPWEMLLFDFFAEAKIIQSEFSESQNVANELKVFKESGRWSWICVDTLQRIQNENYCKANPNNQSETCKQVRLQSSWEWQLENRLIREKSSPTRSHCKLGYKPRRL